MLSAADNTRRHGEQTKITGFLRQQKPPRQTPILREARTITAADTDTSTQ